MNTPKACLNPRILVQKYVPHGSQLALFIEAPYIFQLIGRSVSKDLSGRSTHVLIPSCKNDFISLQFGAISEQQAMRLDFCDILTLFDFDLAINDKLTCSNVDALRFPESAYLFWDQLEVVRHVEGVFDSYDMSYNSKRNMNQEIMARKT